ncbi:MAG: domain/TonB protein [Myxococcaceae bacterium]|nr:domain/TonB protein [Myxococcaceae bacterium]
MSQSARSPGVLLSVRWGDQELAREFLRLDAPRTFTIGSQRGCDFTCGGARAFGLLEIDEDGACLRQKDGTRTALHRGEEPSLLALGPLDFHAQLLDAPPRVRAAPAAELTTLNLGLALLAAFGVFAVAAANADAAGAELDDELSGVPAHAVKMLFRHPPPPPSGSAAAPSRQPMERTPAAASARARTQAPPRPTGRSLATRPDVGSIFRGPGASSVFASTGLGDALAAASTGIRTAEAGNGLGALGGGRSDGNGLGGMSLEGIGTLGTRGGRGPNNRYGLGGMLTPGPKAGLPKFDDPIVEGCAVDGSGCLDKELIGFRFCFESLLNRFPSLEGKVAVRFMITPSGKVSAASVASSTAQNAELERCVSDRTRLLQFPSGKWNGLVGVTYPFIFKQSGK